MDFEVDEVWDKSGKSHYRRTFKFQMFGKIATSFLSQRFVKR